ncbi:hypothetical protein SFRURICE_011484 [Spodoptera frugiperda]|nr:hypothetical protein SFRURICE_011484 [Spodoptera frugiperda]
MHASRIDAGPTAVTKSWGVHNSYTYYMQGGDRRPSENLALPHTRKFLCVDTQTRNNNLWIAQRVVPCGSRTGYTLRGSRLFSSSFGCIYELLTNKKSRKELLCVAIEPGTRYAAAGCSATASTVQSESNSWNPLGAPASLTMFHFSSGISHQTLKLNDKCLVCAGLVYLIVESNLMNK